MSTTQPIRNKERLQLFKEYYLLVKPNLRNYLLIIIGLNSALRISDILHLTFGDIYDFHKKELRTHMVVKEQKTGKTNCIYINQEIRHALKLYADCNNHAADHWLFSGQKKQTEDFRPLSRYQAFRLIKEAAAYAGLPSNVSCHSLRKTFGYHAWKQGTPPALLMSIYNHSSYQITKHYLCIDQDERDAVFQKIIL
ncbi:MAG: tyrosine-type recombinase/integrase [Lachnospiraceae bacterium]|nr:tyrosine-type recombinase/integrase [Lachnospiraceae bacterium]